MGREELKRRAKEALSKPSPYGPDIDITSFIPVSKERERVDLLRLGLERIGIDTTGKSRSGSYYQIDDMILEAYSKVPGLKVLSLEEALDEMWDFIKDYYWKAVPVDKDKFTAAVELMGKGGYVIIVKKGYKIQMPVQTCLLMKESGMLQAPHNIIIAEEGSELTVITGCAAMRETVALHAGVSEFYVGRNAKVIFLMVHSWTGNIHARPRTGALVSEGGQFISQYVNISPVASIQTYPVVRLAEEAKAHLSSLILARGSGIYDVGGEVIFEGSGGAAEIISRALVRDNASWIARARIVALAGRVKGHVECSTLLASDSAKARAVPELESRVKDAILTHEASIGRVASEEIEYLMARGFTEREAVSLIVKGFMNVKIEGLPKQLQKLMESISKAIAERAL